MNLRAMLPGTPGDIYGALEEDLWYGIEMFGLPDFETLRRAYRNMQAILDGDDSLHQYMEEVSVAFFEWLQDFGPGWLVATCYRARRGWLRSLDVDDDKAEEAALTVSRRLAEGQLFRANDPCNNAAAPPTPRNLLGRPATDHGRDGILLHNVPNRTPRQP